jgi:hypothetical protein
MSLSKCIRKHHQQISREFAVFAKTLIPPGAAVVECLYGRGPSHVERYALHGFDARFLDLSASEKCHETCGMLGLCAF